MTCDRTQKLITPFINDELDNDEIEDFINHVNTCSECYEELEVYYTLLTAMKQLDDEERISDDFKLQLSTKLERAEEKIIHKRFSRYRKRSILILLVIAMGLLLGLQNNFISREDENLVTDSDFKLRMQFNSERYQVIEEDLRKNLENEGP